MLFNFSVLRESVYMKWQNKMFHNAHFLQEKRKEKEKQNTTDAALG